MKYPLFVVRSFLFAVVLLLTCVSAPAQSLKGYTLGKEPPVISTNGIVHYQTELKTTVSGIEGVITIDIFHDSIVPLSPEWYNSIVAFKSVFNITSASQYKDKFGVPLIKKIQFIPGEVVRDFLSIQRFRRFDEDYVPYPDLHESSFISNVEKRYSVDLQYSDNYCLEGSTGNLKVTIGDSGFELVNIYLSDYHNERTKDKDANDF